MRKIIFFYFALLALTVGGLHAQDLANYNLYVQNKYLYNPAFTRPDEGVTSFLNTHLQWMGFDGAPKISTFGLQLPVTETMGLGIIAVNTSVGVTNNFVPRLAYSYKGKLGEEHYFTLGISAGVNANTLTTSSIQNVDQSDGKLTNDYYNNTSFFSSVGAGYVYKNLEVQAVLPQLLEKNNVNAYALGFLAYNIPLSGGEWNLKPSVMARGVKTTPTQYDVNLMAEWQKTVWAQAGYRSNNGMIFSAGFNYSGLGFGYAYQGENGNVLTHIGTATHEFQLVIHFGKRSKTEVVKKNIVTGTVSDSKTKQPLDGTIVISEGGKKVSEVSTQNGKFTAELEKGKSYDIDVNIPNYYPGKDILAVQEGDENKNLNIELIPQTAQLAGTITQEGSGKPIKAEIVVMDGASKVGSVSSDANGAYSIPVKSGKKYSLEVNAIGANGKKGDVDIAEKAVDAKADFALSFPLIVKGSVTDVADNSKINGTVNIVKNKAVIKTENVVNGAYQSTITEAGDITLEFKATDYLGQKAKITIDKFATEPTVKDVQLKKVVKGAGFQLGNITFKPGTAELTPESFGTLDKLVRIMDDNMDINIEISGHTDDKGSAEANRKISEKRAITCLDYIVSKGVSASRLKAKGYGKTKPMVPNDSDENRAKNRRVEFKVVE